MVTEKPDTAIITEVLGGDIDMFEIIINRYSDALRGYIRRLGVMPPHDDDVLQTVFLKIYRNLNDFNPSYKFSSWSYRIAHNEAVSYARKRKRMHVFHNEEERERFWDGVLDEADTVSLIMEEERGAVREETKRQLADALSALDRKYADPLILHYFEDKQYREIADILRIPTSTVGTRIRRAKGILRRMIEGV